MSMAQDSNFRAVRSDQPYGDPAPNARANDPLAELARLIGQDDPFAGMSRPPSRASGQGSGPYQPRGDEQQNAPEWLNRSGARAPAPQHDGGYDDQPAESQSYAGDDQHHEHDPRYQDAQQAYPAEEYYDDAQYYAEEAYEPPPKRRGGLMAIVAVLGLALVGTGGVYGYRAWTGPAASKGEPPVIRADDTPTKTVPASPASDNQLASKPQYDRIGDRGGERVVPREEQPVDPKAAARALPPKTPPSGSVLPPPASAQPAAAPNGNEPKKVQTFAIRPDQPMALAATNEPPPAPAPRAAPAPTPAPAPAPASTRSIAQPAQTASVQPAPAAAETGSYVQVSSQVTEADAQASFRSLQAKYPSQLGDHRPTIRRVDLTDKGIGVRYRTLVGPFASTAEAKQFCETYKAAGGKCLIPTN